MVERYSTKKREVAGVGSGYGGITKSKEPENRGWACKLYIPSTCSRSSRWLLQPLPRRPGGILRRERGCVSVAHGKDGGRDSRKETGERWFDSLTSFLAAAAFSFSAAVLALSSSFALVWRGRKRSAYGVDERPRENVTTSERIRRRNQKRTEAQLTSSAFSFSFSAFSASRLSFAA